MTRNLEGLRAVARSQFGLIDRRQSIGNGVDDDAIRVRIGRGEWNRVHPGVFSLNVTPPDWTAGVAAAVLAAGPSSAASHRTAAVLHGLDGIHTRMIELTVPFGSLPVPDGVIVHRTRRELPVALVAGTRVVTVERTLLDLASVVPPLTLEKAVMSAIRVGRTSADLIAEAVSLYGGRGVRGVKKLKRVLLLTDFGITGAASEVDAFSMIREAAVPTPVVQHQIALPGGGMAYPDFAWPSLMKIVEVDGMEGHQTGDQLHNDLKRQNQLMDLGWSIRRFSARSLLRERDRVIGEIVRFVNDT